MNLWRKFQLFSRRLPTEVWLVILLLLLGLSFSRQQISAQRKTAQTAALQKQRAALAVQIAASRANTNDLNQIELEIRALEKRGHVTREEVQSLQNRLERHGRKSKIIRAKLDEIYRKMDAIHKEY